MKITFCCTDTKAEPWLQGLAAVLPGAEISVWQPGAPQADYAVVWAPPQQFMDEQSGLKALFNIGAGVDALLKLRLPPQALVVRLDDGAAVLNAAIAQVAALAPLCDGDVVLYAQDPTLPAIVEHRANANGRAVLVKKGYVVLATGAAEHVLGTLDELTFGRNAVVPDTDALLAAIGAAWALNIAPDLIGAGIKTFEPELQAPVGIRPAGVSTLNTL